MTIEELRDKYSTLEKEHEELKLKYENQEKQSSADKKRIEELEAYNRKIFNDYVLSKDEASSDNTEENQLDNIISKMVENYK